MGLDRSWDILESDLPRISGLQQTYEGEDGHCSIKSDEGQRQ
jgi:hypothetical protein